LAGVAAALAPVVVDDAAPGDAEGDGEAPAALADDTRGSVFAPVVTLAASVWGSATTLRTLPAARSVVSCDSGSVADTPATEVAPA